MKAVAALEALIAVREARQEGRRAYITEVEAIVDREQLVIDNMRAQLAQQNLAADNDEPAVRPVLKAL